MCALNCFELALVCCDSKSFWLILVACLKLFGTRDILHNLDVPLRILVPVYRVYFFFVLTCVIP